jgi:hypothetical protein
MFGYSSSSNSSNPSPSTHTNHSGSRTPIHDPEESMVATEAARLLDHDQHSIQNYGDEMNSSDDHEEQLYEEDPEEQVPPDDPDLDQQQEQVEEQQQQQHQPPEQQEDDGDIAQHITTLTNRLRILFYTLYIPIVPLSALLILLLLQLIYTAAQSPTCSYPLRTFSLFSLLLALYIPNHKMIKSRLFHYTRERDGTVRPRRVRIYDQCFHMMCLSYLYMDMVLIQSCKEDLITVPYDGMTGGGIAGADGSSSVQDATMSISTCSATCPELYPWFQKYDLVLRIFAAILVLPLICLPFVYIWIMRRIHTAEQLFRLDGFGAAGGGGQRRDDDFLAGGVLVKEIMEGLREVVLINEPETETIKIVGVGEKGGMESWNRYREGNIAKECCICMNDFHFENTTPRYDSDGSRILDVDANTAISAKSSKDGLTSFENTTPRYDSDGSRILDADENTAISAKSSKDGLTSSSMEHDINGNLITTNRSQIIVQTKCEHLFHKACIGGWIGGRNWEGTSLMVDGRARRRNCPLCREDLAASSA